MEEQQRVARGVALVFAVAIAVTVVLTVLSPAYGITFDERARHHYGEQVLGYLRGEVPASAFTADESGGHLYGALFDTLAAWVHEQVRGDVWVERHYLCAVFAGVGLLATGLLAGRLVATSVGLLAIVFLALSPRYIGHGMNNPKDIPFAVLCMVALLSFSRIRSTPPFLSWGSAVLIGLALAAPLNVRPGAVLYIGYFGVLLTVLTVRQGAWSLRQLGSVWAHFVVAAVIALTAGTIFWPWAHSDPIVRPFLAFRQTSQFSWHGDVLFAGQQVAANALPWSYVPVWMVITTPPVVLAGLLWAAAVTLAERDSTALWRLGLWTVGLGPIILVIARHSVLYDGWRHLLFVYPPLVVLSASGWRDLIRATRASPRLCGLVIAALVVGCTEPLLFMMENHPNEVVYFNALVHGPHGAFRQFELDYWGNSLLQATGWTEDLAERTGVRLTVSGWPNALVREDILRFPLLEPAEPERGAHHVYVQLLRDSRQGLTRTMSRGDILHIVRTHDGAPLAVVLRGPRFDEIEHRDLETPARHQD
jgi:hypothetical protein